MAMLASEVLAWVQTIDPNDSIAVDDGGLSLVVVEDQEDYLEVGGVPFCEGCEDHKPGTLATGMDRLCDLCRKHTPDFDESGAIRREKGAK